NKDIAPNLARQQQVFADVRSAAGYVIARELDALLAQRAAPATDAAPARRMRWPFGLGGARPHPAARESAEERDQGILRGWARRAPTAESRLDRACLHALGTIGTAIAARRGRLFADKDLITDLTLTLVCNDFASERIGETIAPFIREGARREGFQLLSRQER